MERNTKPGPRLYTLEEIPEEFINRGREMREQLGEVPVGSDEAIWIARYLRASGALKGIGYRDLPQQKDGDVQPDDINEALEAKVD